MGQHEYYKILTDKKTFEKIDFSPAINLLLKVPKYIKKKRQSQLGILKYTSKLFLAQIKWKN